MKKKQYLLYSMIGLLIVVLFVVLIVLLVSDSGEEVQNDQNSNDSEFVLPSDGDYSKYESDYNEMYQLVEYAKVHPEETELNQYVDDYLDKIDSMVAVLPIVSTSAEDSYDYYNITNGSGRSDCPVFCVYVEASTPYMYEQALEELSRVSKYPLDNYVILKNVLYYPIGESEPGY